MHDPELAKEALAELPADIASSPLFNPDLAPVPKSRRNWTTYNFAALWISMAHCIPTYMLAGGLIVAKTRLNREQRLLAAEQRDMAPATFPARLSPGGLR